MDEALGFCSIDIRVVGLFSFDAEFDAKSRKFRCRTG